MQESSKIKENFGRTVIFEMKAGYLKKLTVKDCFEKVVINYIDNPDDLFSTLETISLSCTLIEATLKEKLREINPALTLNQYDPISISIASGKQDSLLGSTEKTLADLPSASATELLKRFLLFNQCKQRNKIEELFLIRNKIVHSSQGSQVDKLGIDLLLTKYIFVFLEEYIHIKEDLWKSIQKMQAVAHSEHQLNIVREIIQARKLFSRMNEKSISDILAKKTVQIDPDSVTNGLRCPACGHDSVTLFVTVEQEGPNGWDYSEVRYATCKICSLWLDEDQYTEITSSPEKYFLSIDNIDDWEQAVIDAEDYLSNKYEDMLSWI